MLYQFEISQGWLEVLLNFQILVIDLIGFEIVNVLMFDEGIVVVEVMILMYCVVCGLVKRVVVDVDVFIQIVVVLVICVKLLGIEIVMVDLCVGLFDGEFFGVIVQLFGVSGWIIDWFVLV